MPIADPELGRTRKQVVLQGDVPSPLDPPVACNFHTRCPRFVDGKCNVDTPPLEPVAGEPTHLSACHFPLERWPLSEEEMRLGVPAAAGATAPTGAPD